MLVPVLPSSGRLLALSSLVHSPARTWFLGASGCASASPGCASTGSCCTSPANILSSINALVLSCLGSFFPNSLGNPVESLLSISYYFVDSR